MNRLNCLRNELNRTKVREKEDEPIIFSKEEDEPNKTTNKAKAPNRNARKDLRHVFKSSYGHGNGRTRWKREKTYVVGVLG